MKLGGMLKSRTGLTCLVLGLFLTGCGIVPGKNNILSDARTSLNTAQNDPKVTQYAQVPLFDAEKAFAKAEEARNSREMRHLAYLAQRQAEIASTVATRRAAEVERERLSKEQFELVLLARERQLSAKALEAQLALEQAESARLQAERLLAQNRELMDQISELQARQTERGLVLTLGDVLFEFSKAEILPSAANNLGKIAEFLNRYPERNLLIEGHTDNVGSDAFNQGLSEQRAAAVRQALVQRGVSPQRIVTRGFGKAMPIESNATETGRQKNRRVEITILNEGVNG